MKTSLSTNALPFFLLHSSDKTEVRYLWSAYYRTGIILSTGGTKMNNRYSPKDSKDSRRQNGNQKVELHVASAKGRELGALGA